MKRMRFEVHRSPLFSRHRHNGPILLQFGIDRYPRPRSGHLDSLHHLMIHQPAMVSRVQSGKIVPNKSSILGLQVLARSGIVLKRIQ